MKLNEKETAILDKTQEIWNLFLELPMQHPNDRIEFMYKLHDLQRMILVRPTRIDNQEYLLCRDYLTKLKAIGNDGLTVKD